jgi:preprotein translocase subunit SecF
MEKDLKQTYLDIVEKNQKRSKIFKRIILASILVSIVLVVLSPPLAGLLFMAIFVLVLFFGVIYAIYSMTQSDAETAYLATLEKDPDAKEPLNIDNVVETYIKGLGQDE